MRPFLQLDEVNVSYGTFVALHSLSLDIQPGEFFCILGPSGSGKTTGLGVIAGFTEHQGGRIRIDGEDITHTPPQRRKMGVVFQSYALFPHMTAAENIGYGLKIRGVDRQIIVARTTELLGLVHLDGKGDRFPRQMSGGEQQRVAIARALAIEPRLMLLDEPLSNLDARLREEMRVELKRIQRATGVTTVLVTHDQEEAFGIADRIAIMNKGKLEQVGTPDDIYWKPQTRFVAEFIGQSNILTGQWSAQSRSLLVAGQKFKCDNDEQASHGTANLFLRPEEIQLGGETRVNNLPGKVESVAALGSTLHIKVATHAAEFLVYRLSDIKQKMKPGDDVIVSWAADAGRIMPGDGK